MDHRNDGQKRPELVQEFDRFRGDIQGRFLPLFSGKTAASPRAFRGLSERAPQHIADIDVWGVSDPAGRAPGRMCGARAGSLTPHFYFTPVLGRSPGGTKRRPKLTSASLRTCCCTCTCSAHLGGTWRAPTGKRRRRVCVQEGPTTPRSSVPLLGPRRLLSPVNFRNRKE